MRITVSQKIQMSFLCLIVLLVASTLWASGTSAQDEPALIIEIYDSNNWNESAGTVVFEGRTYDIMVSSENESVVLDVNISLLGVTYVTNVTEPFITVVAPDFNDTESFVINATKEGYLTAEVEITVMIGQLSVVADRGTVEEKKEFQVTVKDQDNTPVEGASVYLTPEATAVITDQQGIAYVHAPEVEMMSTATIRALKGGYFPGSTNIRIENAEGFAFSLTESQFLKILPILIAVLVVIFSIVYVLWRQRRAPAMPPQVKLREQQDVPHTTRQETKGQRFKNKPAIIPEKRDVPTSIPSSRVEEIRIPVQVKKKETTILSEEKEEEPISEDQKKDQDEWFKGQDYMRYKLDELTGKIDQKTDGKWFEGEHDSKYKVDETLRKSFKKKKVDEEDGK
jgi:hypothetical protein